MQVTNGNKWFDSVTTFLTGNDNVQYALAA